MNDAVALSERKGTVECFPHILLSCILDNMPLYRKKRWRNYKYLLPKHTICCRSILCLSQKPWATPRTVHYKSCTGFYTQIWRKWLHMRPIADWTNSCFCWGCYRRPWDNKQSSLRFAVAELYGHQDSAICSSHGFVLVPACLDVQWGW